MPKKKYKSCSAVDLDKSKIRRRLKARAQWLLQIRPSDPATAKQKKKREIGWLQLFSSRDNMYPRHQSMETQLVGSNSKKKKASDLQVCTWSINRSKARQFSRSNLKTKKFWEFDSASRSEKIGQDSNIPNELRGLHGQLKEKKNRLLCSDNLEKNISTTSSLTSSTVA
jgi:hypothetical protein